MTPQTVIDLAFDLTDGAGGPGGIRKVLVYDPALVLPRWPQWDPHTTGREFGPPAAKVLVDCRLPLQARERVAEFRDWDPEGPPCFGYVEWREQGVGLIQAEGYMWAKTFGGFESAPGSRARFMPDVRVFDSYEAMADALIALAQEGEPNLPPTDPPDLSERLTQSEIVAGAVHGFHPSLAMAMLDVLETVWPEEAARVKQEWYITDDSYPMPAEDAHDPDYYAVGLAKDDDQWFFEALEEDMTALAPPGFYWGASDYSGEWGFWEVEDDEGEGAEDNPRLSAGYTRKDFDPKALAKGTKVEMEHTDDPKVAERIAMDHLVEDPRYYEKLELIETPSKLKNRLLR